ncbi:hypothetical protein FHR99_000357 [Litorivivens lipolytica]|uniref:Membrane dipeptidase (Peptidase family M19) n=1 Tax=Litorivivens lipolytica TaxID=1524264 RepID=A0A7W4W284_9GAMM|nr:hypothetical protein [Litorivivens lipolytica]MBB3046121.1 hypothetical protein [Litorivivens lipolytica]
MQFRFPLLAAAVASSLFLSACNDSSSSSPAPVATPVDVPADKRLTVFSPANRCVTLRSTNAGFLGEIDEGYAASPVLPAEVEPYTFYFKPTGTFRPESEKQAASADYLLLSGYEREAVRLMAEKMATNPSMGIKTLLGISDPNREFLDPDGNFVGEPSAVIAGVGDLSEFFTNAGRIINEDRAGDENADRIGDNSSQVGDGLRAGGDALADGQDDLADAVSSPTLGKVEKASDLAVWELEKVDPDGKHFTLRSQVTGQYLVVDDNGVPALASEADTGNLFELELVENCQAYPEAELNAERVNPGQGPRIYWDGSGRKDVYGWVDDHAHITAYEFIGGRINYGSTHHKFGVDHALHDCEENHGPMGSTGTVEMATSDAFEGHQTRGWPDYSDWPRHDSLQHHQTYYRWMERAFLGGQKILVNLITHNEILCQIVPQKKNDCDGMANVRLQATRTYELQDYIDMQSGGPGKGWFRVVTSPAEARKVIDDGKMAVVLGIELSKVLNCGEFLDQAECTRAQIQKRLDEVYKLGIRLIFPVHKFDNAFGGHLPHSGFALGPILSAGNQAETGHPLEVEECDHDSESDDSGLEENPNDPRKNPVGIYEYLLHNFEYLANQLPPSGQEPDPRTGTGHLCNIRGLTPLGLFLLDELVKRNMLIDLDHISRRAAVQALDHLEKIKNDQGEVYPVISSHDWTNSEYLLNRMADNKGFIGRFARGGRDQWLSRLRGMAARYDNVEFMGGGIASDVNGIAQLPAPPTEGAAVTDGKIDYDNGFLSYDGRIRFIRQVTGDRVFDLYDGRGVAHYGLYPDYIADAEAFGQCAEGEDCKDTSKALDIFFRSAEAYLRMWETVESFKAKEE